MMKSKLAILMFFGLTDIHIKALDTPSFLNELTPKEFSVVHTSRVHKCGGGVDFLIKTALDFKTIHYPEFSSFKTHTVSIMPNGHRLFLGAIYQPPASSVVKFLEDFLPYVGFCLSYPLHLDLR